MEKRIKRTIYIVCGRACSGKDHYYNNMFDTTSFKQIVVSDIVRELIGGATDRSKLADTAYLEFEIVKKLTEAIQSQTNVFIDGIRQPEIIEWLEQVFDEDIFIYVWLEVHADIRKKRFEKRAAVKDKNTNFLDADKNDNKLGLNRVRDLIMSRDRVRLVSPVDIGKGMTSYRSTFKQ